MQIILIIVLTDPIAEMYTNIDAVENRVEGALIIIAFG